MALTETFNIDASGNTVVSGTVTVNPLTNTSIVKAQLQDNAGAAVVLGQALAATSLPVTLTALEEGLFGALTETAPASDTASSGLNGRLQRIAQRLSSLIALFPTSLGSKTSANSLAVVIASDQGAIPVTAATSATGTITSVAGSVTSVTVLASNSSRKGFSLYNDSTAICRVAFAATASATSFTVLLQPQSFFENSTLYTGLITGIWATAAGSIRVTELT